MGTKNKKQQKTQQNSQQSEGPELKFYLKEFSGRLLLLIGSFVVAGIVGFEFKDIIQTLVTLQLADLNMVNFAQAEGTLPTVQISLLAGVLGGLPFAVYHIYRFFAPILARGAWYGFRMVAGSVALLVTAVAYAFMVTIPLGLGTMVAASQTHVATQAFLTFAVGNVMTAVLLSQLPIAMIFLNGIKPFSTKKFLALQGSVVTAIVMFAGIATPSALSGKGITGVLLLAVPVIVMFEASMFWAKLHGRVIVKEMPQEAVISAEEKARVEIPRAAVEAPQPAATLAAPAYAATLAVVSAPAPVPQAVPVQTPAAVPLEDAQPTLEDIFDAMLADDVDEEPEAYYQEEIAEEPAYEPAYEPAQPVFVATPPAVSSLPHAQSQRPSVPATASYAGMPAYRPQPLPQPRPVARRQPAYSRPIADMLRPGQTTTPQLRSLHTPRPTIPFQATM